MNWRTLVLIGLGYLRGAGEAKKAEDENNTGKDDAQGILFVFAADFVEALIKNKPLPKIPKEYSSFGK